QIQFTRQANGFLYTQLLFGSFTHRNPVFRLNLVGRNVDDLAIDQNGFMADHLASLGTGYCEPETVYNVVKSAFQKLEQVFICCFFASCSRLVIVSELLFKHAIGAATLLLFTQLKRIFRQPLAPAVAVLAWRLVELAL